MLVQLCTSKTNCATRGNPSKSAPALRGIRRRALTCSLIAARAQPGLVVVKGVTLGAQRSVRVHSSVGSFGAVNPGQRSLVSRVQSWAQYHQEILVRTLVTMALLVVIRVGHFIPIIGVELVRMPMRALDTTGERFMAALYGMMRDIPASIFDLGISPFIHASIIMQVLLVVPAQYMPSQVVRLQDARKEGKAGEAFITMWINYMAIVLAVAQAVLRAVELQPYALFTSGFLFNTSLALIAGTCIIQYCANTITAYGLGNGSSVVICVSIVHEYAEALHHVINALLLNTVPLLLLALALGLYCGLMLLAVYLSTTELRLPIVQYSSSVVAVPSDDAPSAGLKGGGSSSLSELFASARALVQRRAASRGSSSREYFPLPLNATGMMPVIIAGAFYFGILPKLMAWSGHPLAAMAMQEFSMTPAGLVVYGCVVFALEFLPLGGINPKEIADYFNTINVGLRGVVPGEPTEQELRTQTLRCKFWGGVALAFLAVGAQLFDMACLTALGTTLASTSLLIIVGTILQAARQVETLLEGPKLQRQLDQERALILSLSGL